MIRQRYVLLLLFLLAAAALACSMPGETPDLTATAFKQALDAGADTPVPPEATAEVITDGGPVDGGEQPTDPPPASDTPVPPPTEPPAATEPPPPPPTESAELAAVKEELAIYGVNPDEGRLGWIHPPVEISASGFETSSSCRRWES